MARELVLGVSGSVAAFKAAELAGRFRDAGYRVTAVLTRSATRFVTPLQLECLAEGGAFVDLWTEPMAHLTLAKADVIVVAPATANILGKAASGIGDDLLSTLLLAARGPRVFAPAMNWRMYRNPVVQRNLDLLKSSGAVIVPPQEGRLACGEEGEGRLADVDAILFGVRKALAPGLLAGTRVVVTSGPTREPIDPVRYISNRSSGRMGHALAAEAAVQGAEVTLISGPVGIVSPPGVAVCRVETARDMAAAVREHGPGADVLVMAAAVGDFLPEPSSDKVKRSESLTLTLHGTEDILASLERGVPPALRVGFAAEIGPDLERAREKCRTKGLDMIVFNDVTEAGAGFDVDTNAVTIIHRDGRELRVDMCAKTAVAEIVVREISELLRASKKIKKG